MVFARDFVEQMRREWVESLALIASLLLKRALTMDKVLAVAPTRRVIMGESQPRKHRY